MFAFRFISPVASLVTCQNLGGGVNFPLSLSLYLGASPRSIVAICTRVLPLLSISDIALLLRKRLVDQNSRNQSTFHSHEGSIHCAAEKSDDYQSRTRVFDSHQTSPQRNESKSDDYQSRTRVFGRLLPNLRLGLCASDRYSFCDL